jgi:hypothetical protein
VRYDDDGGRVLTNIIMHGDFLQVRVIGRVQKGDLSAAISSPESSLFGMMNVVAQRKALPGMGASRPNGVKY